jgi:hypothetical protein
VKTNSALRLSEKEWARVLHEARKVAPEADRRLSNSEVAAFVKDRVEVHVGYILMLRPLWLSKDPLVPMPARVREGLSALIGEEALEPLWELYGWHR